MQLLGWCQSITIAPHPPNTPTISYCQLLPINCGTTQNVVVIIVVVELVLQQPVYKIIARYIRVTRTSSWKINNLNVYTAEFVIYTKLVDLIIYRSRLCLIHIYNNFIKGHDLSYYLKIIHACLYKRIFNQRSSFKYRIIII